MASRRGQRRAALPERVISRRSALQSLATASLALLTTGDPAIDPARSFGGLASTLQRRTGTRPNIILIVADDMRADDLTTMPAVRSLFVEQGASFSNFVAAAPASCPARASILRGQYPHNHGVLRGKGELGGVPRFQDLDLEQSTIATWLHDAGYRTGLIGKYLNGYPPCPTAASELTSRLAGMNGPP